MRGMDHVSAINVHMCRSVDPGMSAAYENQAFVRIIEDQKMTIEIQLKNDRRRRRRRHYHYHYHYFAFEAGRGCALENTPILWDAISSRASSAMRDSFSLDRESPCLNYLNFLKECYSCTLQN